MTPFQPSDAELMARTRAGDTASFDDLYRRHVDDARRIARIVSESAEESEDVTAEAFTRVLAQLRRGEGPRGDLRPYLRTVVRRLAVDRYRSGTRGAAPVDPSLVDSLPAPDDPITIATNRDMVRKAYETLPPRWQEVLWRIEVEGHTPGTLAAQVGSTPNAVAALAYRAREGLRQAYLSMHVASSMAAGCASYVPMITALTRGTLTPGEESSVNAHISECQDCRERRDELVVLVSDLRGLLVPALLGTAMLASPGVGLAAGHAAAGGVAGIGGTARHVRPRRSGVGGLVGAAAAVAAASVVAVAMVSSVLDSSPDVRTSDPPVAASAPFDDGPTGGPAPTSEPTPEGETGEPDVVVTSPEPDEPSPAVTGRQQQPAEPAPAAVPAQDPDPESTPDEPRRAEPTQAEPTRAEPTPDDAKTSPPADPDEPARTAEPESRRTTDSNRRQRPEPSPTESHGIAGGAADDPAPKQRAEPPPPPQSGPPTWSEVTPWLCQMIPVWPGCPDDPERPVRDTVCSRMPDLAWCR